MPMRIRVCVCTWSVLQLGDAHRCEVRGMCVFVHIHIHTLAVKLLFRRIRSTVWCTQSRVLFYSTVLSTIGSYLTDAVSIFGFFFFWLQGLILIQKYKAVFFPTFALQTKKASKKIKFIDKKLYNFHSFVLVQICVWN